ncbi:MAG TPA: carboxypeptidase regulatory-like domain-containing protein, partial [Terriglobia bacterium]|nr:carboxypeptidase regulatory-like domain-containing protein [Terriglobia bacterium]
PADKSNSCALPLRSRRGLILDVDTGAPVNGGTVFLVGESWAKFDLGTDGKFEFVNLLPGRYELEVQGLGYPTFRRPLVIDEEDVNLELKTN